MLRKIVLFIIISICFVLQTTTFQTLSFAGITPNLMIIVTASYGFMRGRRSGLLTGFFSGLLYDVLFGNTMGLYALLGMATGWLCGKFNANFYRENYFLPAVLSCSAVFFYDCVLYLFGIVQGISFSFISLLFNIILPEAVYTAVFVIPVYRIVFAVNEQLESRERRNRRLF